PDGQCHPLLVQPAAPPPPEAPLARKQPDLCYISISVRTQSMASGYVFIPSRRMPRPSALPNLQSLVLTSSALDTLSPTLPLLGYFPRLEFLSLMGTPMSKRKWYREWAVHCCKRVRVLDYAKVKMQVRLPPPSNVFPSTLNLCRFA